MDTYLYIIDKAKGDFHKAFFYVRKTMENNWSHNVLLNMMASGLYEREGHAISNFQLTLPVPDSDFTANNQRSLQFQFFNSGPRL